MEWFEDLKYYVKEFLSEITPREVISSLVIISVCMCLGLFISNKISVAHQEKLYRYNTALQTEDESEFIYATKTNVPRILAYGEVTTIDPVSMDGYEGDFCYIEREHEHYTMHTRTVSDGKTTRLETYYTWDTVGIERKESTTVKFLNTEFPKQVFRYGYKHKIDTVYFGYGKDDRYTYRIIPGTTKGTLFREITTEKDGTEVIGYSFTDCTTIESLLASYETNAWNIAFWIAWIIFTLGCVVVYVMQENNWLY